MVTHLLVRLKRTLHRRARALRLAMQDYDAVLLPVIPTIPPLLGFLDGVTDLRQVLSLLPYTYPFNASGQPAVALPAGTSAEGLPIGVQLVGRFGEDEKVAALASRLEAAGSMSA